MGYNLNFHQTFAPEKEAIAQLVQLASTQEDYLTKEEISQRTTIPTGERSGKVTPNIMYGAAMGLFDVEKQGGSYKLSLTAFGKTVRIEDPYFTEALTLLACHYSLTKWDSPALIWAYIFNDMIPQLGLSLEKDTLVSVLTKKYEVSVSLGPFRGGYFNGKMFASLNMIKYEGNNYIFMKHEVDPSLKYLYAYQLLAIWEQHLHDRTEITIDDVRDVLHFGKPYLWTDRDIMFALEMLQDERIVILNRQLTPLTIVKQTSSQAVIGRMYSLLI